MPNPAFHLYQLQKIDLRQDALRLRLREIDTILKTNDTLVKAEIEFNEVEKKLNSIKSDLLEIEKQIKTRKIKVEQSESSLYSGTVKNPKELQDLQKEIVSIKTAISMLEDHELLKMVEADEIDIILKEKRLILESAKTESYQVNERLFLEAESCRQEISKLDKEKKASLDQLSMELSSKYQQLREKKMGIAVSHVEENCCSVCGAELTPAECQAAKSTSTILTCNSCGRMLYAD